MKGYESCVVVTKAKNSKENLCDTCWFCIADCKQTQVKFGDGLGNDNIIECSGYIPAVEEKRIPSFVFCALWVALIIAIFAYIFF